MTMVFSKIMLPDVVQELVDQVYAIPKIALNRHLIVEDAVEWIGDYPAYDVRLRILDDIDVHVYVGLLYPTDIGRISLRGVYSSEMKDIVMHNDRVGWYSNDIGWKTLLEDSIVKCIELKKAETEKTMVDLDSVK